MLAIYQPIYIYIYIYIKNVHIQVFVDLLFFIVYLHLMFSRTLRKHLGQRTIWLSPESVQLADATCDAREREDRTQTRHGTQTANSTAQEDLTRQDPDLARKNTNSENHLININIIIIDAMGQLLQLALLLHHSVPLHLSQ